MDRSDGMIHAHDRLPLHGHCKECISMEKLLFALRDDEQPRLHLVRPAPEISRGLTTPDGSTVRVAAPEQYFGTQYLCWSCHKSIKGFTVVVREEQQGSVGESRFHPRCFAVMMRLRAGVLK